MRRIGSILFEPNGPLMFRGPMEFTPTVRGPQTLARTLPLPLPSTIAGCLATLLLDRGISSLPDPTNWEDALVKILELSEHACLRGPYLLVDDEVYVPFEDKIIGLKGLIKTLKEIDVREAIREGEILEEVFKHVIIHPKKIEHIGIGLKSVAKAVERGLLYSAEFIDYLSTFNGRKVHIAIDIHGATALEKLPSLERYIVRLGGEGRTVSVKFEENSYLLEKIKRVVREAETEKEYLIYMVSPALIRTPLTNLTSVISTRALRFSLGGINVELLTGCIDILGAGFDIRHRVRKPMYASITQGSLLIAEDKQATLAELYQHGLSDIGGRLGYGTIIPLPIS
ncbi:MAG: hypothetical protein J7K21_00420 [Desulfurococcales archaeon]|nr:hypothetical protein [Desulfurococcales archaeon]